MNKLKPKKGKLYYTPNLKDEGLYSIEAFADDEWDRTWLERGLICETKEEAIELTKKMLEVAKRRLLNE